MIKLTPRERAVARHIVGGYNTESIAAQFDISINTAKVHIHRVMRKTGSKSMQHAAMQMLRNASMLSYIFDREEAA